MASRVMTRKQRLTLLAAILGSALVAVDSSIVSVALPAIERDLGGGLAAQQWVSNSYLLALGSLILVGGSLGDIYGERRVFAIGVAAFGVLSFACALAPTIGVLIAARAVQGAAAALVTPSSLAIIVAAFAPRNAAPRSAPGPPGAESRRSSARLRAGWIVDQLSWRWIFALNIPLVAGRCCSFSRRCPPSTRVTGRRIDVVGACLGALGLGGSRVRADRAAALRLERAPSSSSRSSAASPAPSRSSPTSGDAPSRC